MRIISTCFSVVLIASLFSCSRPEYNRTATDYIKGKIINPDSFSMISIDDLKESKGKPAGWRTRVIYKAGNVDGVMIIDTVILYLSADKTTVTGDSGINL